jgi:hypothetical protein
MRKVLTIITVFIFLSIVAQAQLTLSPAVIAAGGQFYSSDNLAISWTIGEVAVATLRGDNLVLNQGFQQPFGTGTGIKNNGVKGNIFVYPNPVSDVLYIRFDLEKRGDYVLGYTISECSHPMDGKFLFPASAGFN